MQFLYAALALCLFYTIIREKYYLHTITGSGQVSLLSRHLGFSKSLSELRDALLPL